MELSDVIAGVAAALALVSIVVSLYVAYRQNELTRRSQFVPIVAGLLQDEFRSADFKRRTDFIETELRATCPPNPDGTLSLTDDARNMVRPVMSYFNNVGLLLANGAVSAELVSSIMGGTVANTWRELGPFIYAERSRRGGDPNYYGYFEHLAASVREIGPEKLDQRLGLKKLPPVD